MQRLLKNLSLKSKIMGTVCILLALLLFNAGYAIFSMNKIDHELSAIAGEDIELTKILTEVTIHQLEQSIQFERALHYGSILQREEKSLGRFRKAVARFDELSVLIEAEIDDGTTIAKGAIANGAGDNLHEFQSVTEQLTRIKQEHKQFEDHAHDTFTAITQGQRHEAELLAEEIEKEEDKLNHEIETLLFEVNDFTAASAKKAKEHEEAAIYMLSITTLLSCITGLAISWMVVNTIVKGLRRAIVTASGDLTQEILVDSKDEVGELLTAMNGMRQRLLGMLSQISGTTVQLAAAAEEMSVITNQTSQTIQEQRLETEQVATAMNEMTATAHEVASNISQTATSANDAREQTHNGESVVQQTVDQINKLAKQVEKSSQVINEVGQNSESIGSVLDVIRGIAEQTNLLALNAAIEAARAGEYGRGFAVVADEVRTLAGRTQQSTDEINEMIKKLQMGSREAVEVMESSRTEAIAAVECATQTGSSLKAIAEAVERINEMAVQISSAAEQQGAVAEEINVNIVKINDMSSQTAEGAEETAVASQELTRMATELQSIVGEFKV